MSTKSDDVKTTDELMPSCTNLLNLLENKYIQLTIPHKKAVNSNSFANKIAKM